MRYKVIIEDRTPGFEGNAEILCSDREQANKKAKEEMKIISEYGMKNITVKIVSHE